jgi:hypothetical protein
MIVAQVWLLTPHGVAAPRKHRDHRGMDPEVHPTTTEARFVLLRMKGRTAVALIFAEVLPVWSFFSSGLNNMGLLVVSPVGTVAPSDASHSQARKQRWVSPNLAHPLSKLHKIILRSWSPSYLARISVYTSPRCFRVYALHAMAAVSIRSDGAGLRVLHVVLQFPWSLARSRRPIWAPWLTEKDLQVRRRDSLLIDQPL